MAKAISASFRSAGFIVSPKLLELSRVGDGEILGKLGIDVVHHLPGVGENLQDHVQSRITYETNSKGTINDILNSRTHALMALTRYLVFRDGLMSISSPTVHAIMRSSGDAAYPDLKLQIGFLSADPASRLAVCFGRAV